MAPMEAARDVLLKMDSEDAIQVLIDVVGRVAVWDKLIGRGLVEKLCLQDKQCWSSALEGRGWCVEEMISIGVKKRFSRRGSLNHKPAFSITVVPPPKKSCYRKCSPSPTHGLRRLSSRSKSPPSNRYARNRSVSCEVPVRFHLDSMASCTLAAPVPARKRTTTPPPSSSKREIQVKEKIQMLRDKYGDAPPAVGGKAPPKISPRVPIRRCKSELLSPTHLRETRRSVSVYVQPSKQATGKSTADPVPDVEKHLVGAGFSSFKKEKPSKVSLTPSPVVSSTFSPTSIPYYSESSMSPVQLPHSEGEEEILSPILSPTGVPNGIKKMQTSSPAITGVPKSVKKLASRDRLPSSSPVRTPARTNLSARKQPRRTPTSPIMNAAMVSRPLSQSSPEIRSNGSGTRTERVQRNSPQMAPVEVQSDDDSQVVGSSQDTEQIPEYQIPVRARSPPLQPSAAAESIPPYQTPTKSSQSKSLPLRSSPPARPAHEPIPSYQSPSKTLSPPSKPSDTRIRSGQQSPPAGPSKSPTNQSPPLKPSPSAFDRVSLAQSPPSQPQNSKPSDVGALAGAAKPVEAKAQPSRSPPLKASDGVNEISRAQSPPIQPQKSKPSDAGTRTGTAKLVEAASRSPPLKASDGEKVVVSRAQSPPAQPQKAKSSDAGTRTGTAKSVGANAQSSRHESPPATRSGTVQPSRQNPSLKSPPSQPVSDGAKVASRAQSPPAQPQKSKPNDIGNRTGTTKPVEVRDQNSRHQSPPATRTAKPVELKAQPLRSPPLIASDGMKVVVSRAQSPPAQPQKSKPSDAGTRTGTTKPVEVKNQPSRHQSPPATRTGTAKPVESASRSQPLKASDRVNEVSRTRSPPIQPRKSKSSDVKVNAQPSSHPSQSKSESDVKKIPTKSVTSPTNEELEIVIELPMMDGLGEAVGSTPPMAQTTVPIGIKEDVKNIVSPKNFPTSPTMTAGKVKKPNSPTVVRAKSPPKAARKTSPTRRAATPKQVCITPPTLTSVDDEVDTPIETFILPEAELQDDDDDAIRCVPQQSNKTVCSSVADDMVDSSISDFKITFVDTPIETGLNDSIKMYDSSEEIGDFAAKSGSSKKNTPPMTAININVVSQKRNSTIPPLTLGNLSAVMKPEIDSANFLNIPGFVKRKPSSSAVSNCDSDRSHYDMPPLSPMPSMMRVDGSAPPMSPLLGPLDSPPP